MRALPRLKKPQFIEFSWIIERHFSPTRDRRRSAAGCMQKTELTAKENSLVSRELTPRRDQLTTEGVHIMALGAFLYVGNPTTSSV